MSEPYWSALGGGVVDYEGAWAAGTQYAPGDVVRHNGIDYLAVNPSLGVDPGAAVAAALVPLGTALPASPTDGQEIILVDSLTAPTFSWHLRYVAAKASNKWVFLGGAPAVAHVAVGEMTTSITYVDLTTPGPSIVVPVAGEYIVTHWVQGSLSVNTTWSAVAVKKGAAATTDDESSPLAGSSQPNNPMNFTREQKITGVLAGDTLKLQYRVGSTATATFLRRTLHARPHAVGG